MTNTLEILRPKDAAKLLGVSQSYVYQLAEKGLIGCIRIPMSCANGKQKSMLRFKTADLMAFVEEHYNRPLK